MYYVTNENLEAIMLGLDIQEGDRVLAICGSGDQALAMLENGAEVVAVDKVRAQLVYAREQVKLLRQGNFDGFLNPPQDDHTSCFYQNRKEYFSCHGRLEKIRSNLGRISFIEGNIFCLGDGTISIVQGPGERILPALKSFLWNVAKTILQKPFTKIYLSNAVDLSYFDVDSYSIGQLMDRLVSGGLIYQTCRYESDLFKIVHRLKLDIDLTSIAQSKEKMGWYRWWPMIYRKE